jgi:hypothetical protein
MSNKVANSILSGVLKVTGFVTSTVMSSKPAQKFFKLMPGEVILASLDGFGMTSPYLLCLILYLSCICWPACMFLSLLLFCFNIRLTVQVKYGMRWRCLART